MADGDVNLILKGFDSYEVSLGDALRGERATLGKSLLDVERDLKIRAAYIAAIEECDIKAFPNTGFVAGYVRSYARYLNLDPDPTFEAFCREANFKGTDVTTFEQTSKSKIKSPKITEIKSGSLSEKWEPGPVGVIANNNINTANFFNSIGPALVLVLLLGSLGYGGLKIFQNIQRIDLVAIEQSPVVQNGPIASFDSTGNLGSVSNSGVNADVLALYSDQIMESSLSNPRDGRIADIDSNKTGFYAESVNEGAGLSFSVAPNILGQLNLPEIRTLEVESDQPLNYGKTVGDLNKVKKEIQNILPLPSFYTELPRILLFSFGPSWIKLESEEYGTSYEVIMDSQNPLEIGSNWFYSSLRAGNANNLFFIVNGAAFGPLSNKSVIKNVEVSEINAVGTFQYNSEVTALYKKKFGSETKTETNDKMSSGKENN